MTKELLYRIAHRHFTGSFYTTTKDELCKALDEYVRDQKPVTGLKYTDIENLAKQRWPKDVWQRNTFKLGALYALEEVYKRQGKTREEMIDDLEVPTATMD